MRKLNTPFLFDQYYHIYNRAVGDEKMFRDKEDYDYFLQLMERFVLPVSDVFCYNFLPNHFHLFVRVKPISHIQYVFNRSRNKSSHSKYDENRSLFLSEQFGSWCNAYTKWYNKRYGRKGKLFMDNLNRKLISNDSYYSKIVHYIHANAPQHQLCKHIADWPYSSFASILHGTNPLLARNELISWFGNLQAFIEFHNQPIQIKLKQPTPRVPDPRGP